jgi:hypothetical protein
VITRVIYQVVVTFYNISKYCLPLTRRMGAISDVER